MEPPHESTRLMNPEVVQHEYLERFPPIATINQHQDLARHIDPLPRSGQDASPAELRHHQELNRGDIPMFAEKVERARTHGPPKHPIWQFFTHVLTTHEQIRDPAHAATTAHDHMDVTCALCGVHIHQDHTLGKGEDESIEEIKLARSVLHGMWDHLASQRPECPHSVRHDMKTWRPLPKESSAAPAAPAIATEEDDDDSDDSASHLLAGGR